MKIAANNATIQTQARTASPVTRLNGLISCNVDIGC